MDKRDRIHNAALAAWKRNKKRGTVQIATGVGKTFIFLHALHSMIPDDRIHLFLAEVTDRKKDLKENIKKYDAKYKVNTLDKYNLQFHCYQTVRDWEDVKNIGLVGADEIHDSLTPSNSNFYKNNHYDAIIGLSALVDVNTEYLITDDFYSYRITKGDYLNKYAPVVYNYSINDARADDLNRDLNIHIIKHQLDDKLLTVRSGSKQKPFFQTELKAYNYWDKRFKEAKKEKDYIKRHLLQRVAISRRAKILYNLRSKVISTRKLLTQISRTIIFGNSIDALLNVIPHVVSSRNPDYHNDWIRSMFENEGLHSLGSFKKLKQGANINNLNNMILMSYYSKEKDVIQRFGRLRKNKDKIGNIFIFVTENTQEEVWYKEMFKNIEETYKKINHESIDDCIKYIRNEKCKCGGNCKCTRSNSKGG